MLSDEEILVIMQTELPEIQSLGRIPSVRLKSLVRVLERKAFEEIAPTRAKAAPLLEQYIDNARRVK